MGGFGGGGMSERLQTIDAVLSQLSEYGGSWEATTTSNSRSMVSHVVVLHVPDGSDEVLSSEPTGLTSHEMMTLERRERVWVAAERAYAAGLALVPESVVDAVESARSWTWLVGRGA